MYGQIQYDEDGKPMCEICGKYFHRVLSHARQKHEINEREYKKRFGLDLIVGICSKESAERTRIKTLENYDKCIAKNLIRDGEKTRFILGSEGRTIDKVSAQTMAALKERLKKISTPELLQRLGKDLGNYGFGNYTQWGTIPKTSCKEK